MPRRPTVLPLNRLRTAPPCISEQTREFRQRLERSGLAQAIAGGLDLLPEIGPHLPEIWRPLNRLFAPRRPEQVAVHVLSYLGWYLNPRESARTGLPYLGLVVAILLFFGGLPTLLALSGHFAVLLAIALFLLLAAVGARTHLGRVVADVEPHSADDLEAVEFFCYLLDSYSDE